MNLAVKLSNIVWFDYKATEAENVVENCLNLLRMYLHCKWRH